MDEPSWQRREDLENLETERLIDEQGERESRQSERNKRWGGDDLDLEAGLQAYLGPPNWVLTGFPVLHYC